MKRQIVIAIDGPAASGKSSTAQWVAQRLGYCHVDSGALYRAATAARLREAGDPERWTEEQVLTAARKRVTLVPEHSLFVPRIDGALADDEIRGKAVTQHVSRVARMQGVRAWVNDQVRQAAQQKPVVVDGRDIGTTVFPDADLKVFLIADPWERARRRLIQQLQRSPNDEEIAEETDRLVQRDARDAQQSGQAPGAILLDTTYLTQEEQVDRIVALAHAVTQRGEGTSVD
ncbi:MAG TPA: (d)CMP kinase [Gemmatimonadaceae bacterium]|nr:(d)CMP kinase [Gemmatimonadaceae bacterium]